MDKLSIILKKAEKERDALNHPYVGTEHLTLAILSRDNELTEELKKYKLTYNKFKKKLISIIGEGSSKSPYILYTPMLRNVIELAKSSSLERHTEITETELFQSIIDEGEGIAIRVMQAMKINPTEILINNNNNYMKVSLNDIVTEREQELSTICQILMRKDKCNPLLIGDAGVGKTAIVEELARRLLTNKVPNALKNYKIMKIDLSDLLSGTKYRGEFEEKLNKVIKDAINKRVVLFIDEIHTLVTAGGADGAISAGDIVKPYLARGDIKCIGATTINEYHQYFEIDQALNRRFQTLVINETPLNVTKNILTKILPNYEKYHNVRISSSLIDEIINNANLFLINRRNPDKSIELLDSCCTHAVFNERKDVTSIDLYELLNDRYGIDLSNNNIKKLILERKALITKNITDLINKIKNNNCNVININCNNFQSNMDMFDLLGNPQDLHKNQFYLLKSALDKPLGLITITNINSNIILKEFIDKLIQTRIITDNFGNKINLKNYIIVLDSNNKYTSIGFTQINKDINVNNSFTTIDENNLINI